MVGIPEESVGQRPYFRRKEVWAWALYDWGNSAFATTVIAGFFPLFYANYYNQGSDPAESSALLAYTSLIASLVIALLSPFLAAVAEFKRNKKAFLGAFAFLGALGTAGLALIPEAQWFAASACFAVASIGFSGSIVFYDAFLKEVSQPSEEHQISSLGYSLGYLGGGLLFLLNVLMFSFYQELGFSSQAVAIKYSFVSVSIWWLLFTIPVLRMVPEEGRRIPRLSAWTIFFDSVFSVWAVVTRIVTNKQILIFLIGYWMYIDGVNSVIRLAVSYARSLVDPAGIQLISSQHLISALLLTQFVAFPAALAFGWFGKRFGAVRSILGGLCLYLLATIWAARMDQAWEFYFLACLIGLVQGGVQALSRSYFAEITPKEDAAEYFSFYNLVGKFASILGPGLYAILLYLGGSPRVGILGLIPLFLVGGFLLFLSSRVQRSRAR